MPTKFKPVTHVIFDMDGVLLNTEDLYTEVYQKLCGKYGKIFDWSIKLPMMGKPPLVAAEYIIEKLQLPFTPEKWQESMKSEMSEVFPRAVMLPGVEKLVRHLKACNVPIAICSGSSRVGYELKSTNYKDFFALFDHITLCGDDPDVKHGKPHPDAYIVSNSRFNPAPEAERVLVIEDAPNGVVAAVSAGMQVVMVPDPNVPTEFHKGSTLVLESLTEFKPEDFGLPPYKTC